MEKLTEKEKKIFFDIAKQRIIKIREPIEINGKKYYAMSLISIFRPQLYRVFSLLANKLGIESVQYDYISEDENYILYSESMINSSEVLYEDELCDDSFTPDIFGNYIDVITRLEKNGISGIREQFAKQIFFSLLIFDCDKEIGIISDKKLAPYYDYGGVFFNQDVRMGLNVNYYYVEESKQQLFKECEVTEQEIEQDFYKYLKNEVIEYDESNLADYDRKLKYCLKYLNDDFIRNCLDVDIMEILNSDCEHEYSEKFKIVITAMMTKSKTILIEKMKKIIVNKNIEETSDNDFGKIANKISL